MAHSGASGASSCPSTSSAAVHALSPLLSSVRASMVSAKGTAGPASNNDHATSIPRILSLYPLPHFTNPPRQTRTGKREKELTVHDP